MFDLGMQELILIFIVALLIFGPKKLPELSRALGKGIRELKIALRGVQESIDEAETTVSEEIKEAKTGIEESLTKEVQQVISNEKVKEDKTETQVDQNISKPGDEKDKEKSETEKHG